MSFRSIRSRQESCIYRLNRAALMRMEEGKRKAMTREEGYYDNGTICVQVVNPRHQFIESNSIREHEIYRTDEDSIEEGPKLRTSAKHHRRRNRDNASINSCKSRTSRLDKPKGHSSSNRKLRSANRRKTSTISSKLSEVEEKEWNARRTSIGSKVNRTSAVQRPKTPGARTPGARTRLPRPRTPHSSSHSSDEQLQERTGLPHKTNRINDHGNVTWTSSPPTSFIVNPVENRKSEEDITIPKPTLLGSIMVKPSKEAETERKPAPDLKQSEKRTLHMNPKQPFDESLLVKQQKMNDMLYEHLKRVSRGSSTEEVDHEKSVRKMEKRCGERSSSRKRSGPTRKLHFKPLPSTVTVSSDQEEVISKWRKRLGTSSPPAPNYHKIGSPIIASSFLRDSHILRVQGVPNQGGNESDIKPEKDPPDISLENLRFERMVRAKTGKRPNEVLSASEENEIFQKMEMMKTKKQIHYLEELARAKMEKLEAIQWKKKRALEEEAVLNDKLEKLLYKIQELRESDSFAKLLDKQTQVFSMKRTRPTAK
ncbi:unnamed protein product [Nezara viridula]|uniref:Uncharacterized protein n=1 Tax=Nezara viridula TaxID=85310 RepID=A0A9P0HBT4_NEZVI|nr:unnamed protein product [Nezara viridula]